MARQHDLSDGQQQPQQHFVPSVQQNQNNMNGGGNGGNQDINFDALDGTGFDFGETNIGLGMPFFDFEGINTGTEQVAYPFAN